MDLKVMEWLLTGEGGAALIGGVISIIGSLILFLSNRISSSSNKFFKRVKTVRESNEIISNLRRQNQASVERVLIVKTSNGGGVPKPTTHVYSSVLEETYDDHVKPLKPDWQNQMTDSAYDEIIMKLSGKKMVKVKTLEMENGMVKNIYLRNGSQGAINFMVRDQFPFVYVSVVIDKDADIDQVFEDPRLSDDIRIAQNKLMQLYKKGVFTNALHKLGRAISNA